MTAQSPEPSTKLVIRKNIPLPREKVFAAWLDAESMRTWMCPPHIESTEAELDARVGGKFRIVMRSKERDYEHRGEYRVIEPPSKLVFTWISAGTDWQETLVTVELAEHGAGCELTLTHEGFPSAEKVEGHRKGWGEIVDLLAGYLSRPVRM